MRTLLIALLVSTAAFGVQAQDLQAQELQLAGPAAAVSAEPVLEQRVQKRLEALGYKDIQVTHDVVVVRARDESDQAIVLLVDPDTLLNVKIDTADEEASTTGSGSAGR
jgi:hypothetical protein